MEEGSSGVGNLGGDRVFKDGKMPDGDACRPDGTLKEANEMEFPNSPSEVPRNLLELPVSRDSYFFLNLKRSLPGDDSNEEEGEEDSDEDMESVEGPQSKGQRKVSMPITPQIIICLPLTT
jgi:hypothetical protein